MVSKFQTINEISRHIGFYGGNGDKLLRERLKSEGIDYSALDENMIKRRRRNLSDVSDEQLHGLVERSSTFAKLCFLMGYKKADKSLIDAVKERCDKLGIDTSRLVLERVSRKLCTRKIQTIPRDELVGIVKRNKTMTGVLADLGYSGCGRTQMLRHRLVSDGIDFSNLRLTDESSSDADRLLRISKYEKYLVEDSPHHGNMYKSRLIRDKLLQLECGICGIGQSWNGLNLVLQLDHINGKNKDNRLENLRLLCPNCHSQTDTYCRGRVAVDGLDGSLVLNNRKDFIYV